MHHPSERIIHTTTFVTPVVEHWLEREIAQWVHPMKDRSDDPSHHERTLLPRVNKQKHKRQWYRSEHVFLELLDGDLELTFQVPHVHFGLLLVDLLLFEGHVRLAQRFLLQFAEQLVEVAVVERSLEVVVVVHWSRKYSEMEIVYKSYMKF